MANGVVSDNMGRTTRHRALAIRFHIDREAAWQVLESKLPGCKRLSIDLSYHPFSAFEFDIIVRSSSTGRIGVLVDAVGGLVSTIPEWPETRWLFESERNATRSAVLDADTTRVRARRAAASCVMRKLKIGKLFTLSETKAIGTLWKPNWMVQSVWRNQNVRVLVDGLDGSYYVISAEARSPCTASRDRCAK